MADLIAGVDLGGTQVRVAVADMDGHVRDERWGSTPGFASADAFIGWVAAAIRELAAGEPVGCVGIGAPGPLDPAAGRIKNAANLPAFCRDLPVADLLQVALDCPVHLENDANLAAVGEHGQGAGRGTRHLVYVTWSTGIGAGIIIEGRLYSGASGNAGEVGHMVIDPQGPDCLCGQRGCLEAYAGGRGIERATGRPAQAVFEAAAAGDPPSRAVVAAAARALGVGLLNLANLFDPEVIVVGGGVTGSWDLVATSLAAPLAESPFVTPDRRPPIKRSELGTRVGLIGAVEWARHKAAVPDRS